MIQRALTARPGLGQSVFVNPLIRTERQFIPMPPAQTGPAVSACLSAEDDFELGEEFLAVYIRASERIAGFFAGCAVIGIVWLAFSLI